MTFVSRDLPAYLRWRHEHRQRERTAALRAAVVNKYTSTWLRVTAADFSAVDKSASASRAATRSGYRADIDGLRAIAVLAVVATHAGIAGFAGGYVGVDVFFVISGYLIGRQLKAAPPVDWRGLAAFYGRRMRRTLPALYLVAFTSLAAASILLLPGEIDAFARSLLAALGFVPNILFLNQAGYFDHAAIGKPLLHTWSLGVEEQFYFIAPLLALGVRQLPASMRPAVLVGLFGVSLVGCIALQAANPAAAFYLMPTRLWEFLAGVIVAEEVLPAISAWLAEIVAACALIALAAAIGTFSAATTHPGLPTLLPCLATAWLIHLGRSRATFASRLLGSPPMAAVGLISYSIYLWHWPLLVFGRLLHIELSAPGQLGGLALLLGLAALTWRRIEQPFRDPNSMARRGAARSLPAVACGLAVASLVIVVGRGLPGRFPPKVAAVAGYYDYNPRPSYRSGQCFVTSREATATVFDRAGCLRMAADRHNVLLIGDSHAAHLYAGFKATFPAVNILQATASGCKPLLHTTGKRYCTDLMREMFGEFFPQHRLDTVYLSAAWDLADADDLAPTLAYLRRYAGRVVVIGRIPAHSDPLPTLLARSLLDHDQKYVAEQAPYPFQVDRLFRTRVPAADYISLTDALCPGGLCAVWATPGVPLQFDWDHLTAEGSRVVATIVAKVSSTRQGDGAYK